MHARLHLTAIESRDTEMLDVITELFRVSDVFRSHCANTLGIGCVEIQGAAESDSCHDGELMRGVYALDIEGGVGLGIAQCLCFDEHISEFPLLLHHLGENEITCAVDDAR